MANQDTLQRLKSILEELQTIDPNDLVGEGEDMEEPMLEEGMEEEAMPEEDPALAEFKMK